MKNTDGWCIVRTFPVDACCLIKKAITQSYEKRLDKQEIYCTSMVSQFAKSECIHVSSPFTLDYNSSTVCSLTISVLGIKGLSTAPPNTNHKTTSKSFHHVFYCFFSIIIIVLVIIAVLVVVIFWIFLFKLRYDDTGGLTSSRDQHPKSTG